MDTGRIDGETDDQRTFKIIFYNVAKQMSFVAKHCNPINPMSSESKFLFAAVFRCCKMSLPVIENITIIGIFNLL